MTICQGNFFSLRGNFFPKEVLILKIKTLLCGVIDIWHKRCISKKIVGSLLLTASLLTSAACSLQNRSTPPLEEGNVPRIQPITFASGSVNGLWVSIAAAIAEKSNQYFQGYPITATTGGAIANPYLLQNGQAAIGLSQGFLLEKAQAGLAPYEGVLDSIQGIASLETTVLYLITDKQSPAGTLEDLMANGGKARLGVLPRTDSSYLILQYVLAGCGLNDAGDLQEPGTDIYFAEGGSLFKAYNDLYFDLLVINKALPDAALSELLSKRESVLLSLKPDTIRSLTEKHGWSPVTIPAGTYPGQEEDVLTIGIKTLLIVHQDLPEEVAYYLTKSVYENKAFYEIIHDSYKKVNVNDFPNDLVVPLHPGARRYYEEIGLLAKSAGDEEDAL